MDTFACPSSYSKDSIASPSLLGSRDQFRILRLHSSRPVCRVWLGKRAFPHYPKLGEDSEFSSGGTRSLEKTRFLMSNSAQILHLHPKSNPGPVTHAPDTTAPRTFFANTKCNRHVCVFRQHLGQRCISRRFLATSERRGSLERRREPSLGRSMESARLVSRGLSFAYGRLRHGRSPRAKSEKRPSRHSNDASRDCRSRSSTRQNDRPHESGGPKDPRCHARGSRDPASASRYRIDHPSNRKDCILRGL